MAQDRQKSLDGNAVTDEATITSVALNSSTSTKILDSNLSRQTVNISNITNFGIWIKKQAASVDNDKKGIFLPKRASAVLYTTSEDKYYGELCAISASGTPTINITEN